MAFYYIKAKWGNIEDCKLIADNALEYKFFDWVKVRHNIGLKNIPYQFTVGVWTFEPCLNCGGKNGRSINNKVYCIDCSTIKDKSCIQVIRRGWRLHG